MTITVFTKPGCPYCAKTKGALDDSGLSYEEIDVKASTRNADASVYFSGEATVPQAFFGDIHVNGSTDVVALQKAGGLKQLARSTSQTALSVADTPDQELARGAKDLPLRDIIPESDGTHDSDPETWAILHMYKEFFGFWPNCFYFMHHWPEAYKLFVYCHNAGAIGQGKEILGAPVMMAEGFSTSSAHGCNYCMTHSVATGGDMSLAMPKLIEAARQGKAPADAPIGPFELELIDLAADAAKNTVTDKRLDNIRSLAGKARVSKEDADANIASTAMIASAFGFLNAFNDLTGVKVEAEWSQEAEKAAGVSAGRHGVSTDRSSTNLDYDLPEGGPSLPEMMAKYDGIVEDGGGAEPYALDQLGLVPSWIAAWPQALKARHVYFYTELMEPRSHSPIPSELKHLMMRVAHIARDHDELAAVEGLLAHRAAGKTSLSVERVRQAFAAATDVQQPRGLFEVGEIAALKLAWISAQMPLTTPRRFVEPALETWGHVELVHLMTVCALAGLVQRFAAIAKPPFETETRSFLAEHGLEHKALAIRYPHAFADRSNHMDRSDAA